MSQEQPDLSIVTVVLNDETGLEKAIKSVKNQKGLAIQHIIVDGGSSDRSAQIALKNSSVHIESKPDGGIYPAMHRGALAATGEFITFCNAGDALFGEEFLAEAISKLRDSKARWGFGSIIEFTQRDTFSWIPADKTANQDSIIGRNTFVPFPSFVIERNLYFEIGSLTANYKIAGDFELICKAAMNSDPLIFKHPIALFSAGGISYEKADLAWREEIAIRKKLLHLGLPQLTIQWLHYFLRLLKWRFGKMMDISQKSLFGSRQSWRDARANKVPEIYKQFLPKNI